MTIGKIPIIVKLKLNNFKLSHGAEGREPLVGILKRTAEMSPAEIELQEIRQLVRELRAELMELRSLAERIRIEAQVSHCLLVVRKVSEDKVKQVDDLLD